MTHMFNPYNIVGYGKAQKQQQRIKQLYVWITIAWNRFLIEKSAKDYQIT